VPSFSVQSLLTIWEKDFSGQLNASTQESLNGLETLEEEKEEFKKTTKSPFKFMNNAWLMNLSNLKNPFR
jgi:hypothetical protein